MEIIQWKKYFLVHIIFKPWPIQKKSTFKFQTSSHLIWTNPHFEITLESEFFSGRVFDLPKINEFLLFFKIRRKQLSNSFPQRAFNMMFELFCPLLLMFEFKNVRPNFFFHPLTKFSNTSKAPRTDSEYYLKVPIS